MALHVAGHQTELHLASTSALNAAKQGANFDHDSAQTISSMFMERRAIPEPALFLSLKTRDVDLSAPPGVGECAVHLELLEAFRALRINVLNSTELDVTLGIKPRHRTVTRVIKGVTSEVQLADETFAERRKQKWPLFLRLAVSGFRVWIKEVDRMLEFNASAAQELLSQFVPPLDVLMVWHSFLLNPREYHEFCNENSYHNIRRVKFPWSSIHSFINMTDCSYQLSTDAERWTNTIGLNGDLLLYLEGIGEDNSPASKALATYGELMEPHSIRISPTLLRHLSSQRLGFIQRWNATLNAEAINTELSEAVQRQAEFVEKMHAQLWIRSPAVQGTLRRAVNRYVKFVKLFKLYPNTMLVPTLDIDLVWHTHQCSAARYAQTMRELAGRFINHNDKLEKPVLGDGMAKTKELFRVRYGQEYATCLCWDCEATLSAVLATGSKDMKAMSEKVYEDIAYYKMAEVARRTGNPLPTQ